MQTDFSRLGGMSKTMTPMPAESLKRTDVVEQRSEMVGRKLNFFGGEVVPQEEAQQL